VKSAEEAYYVKNKAYGDATALTTAPNKLLGATPSLVAITVTGGGSGYTLAWAGACTSASGLPATP
jgi:hypothetical protein